MIRTPRNIQKLCRCVHQSCQLNRFAYLFLYFYFIVLIVKYSIIVQCINCDLLLSKQFHVDYSVYSVHKFSLTFFAGLLLLLGKSFCYYNLFEQTGAITKLGTCK